MWRLIKFLFTGDGHLHKWEEVASVPVEKGKYTIGRVYYYKCRVCGLYKKKSYV